MEGDPGGPTVARSGRRPLGNKFAQGKSVTSAAALPTPATTVPAPLPVGSDPRRLFWVDWLRFLAAALVLLDHACQWNWPGPDLSVAGVPGGLARFLVAPAHLGRQAVIVFFVLSGALVGGLTLRKIRAGTFDASVYAADRLSRVYLPLIPALLLTIATFQTLGGSTDPLAYLACLFGLQDVWLPTPVDNHVLWTLSYEIWFYVLAGCVAVTVTGRGRSSQVRLAALAGAALSVYLLCFRLEWINLACWFVGAGGFWVSDRLRRPPAPGSPPRGRP